MTNSFDHLLREALKGKAPLPDPCLDAEVLAAWFEGTLDTATRATVEAHAAECSRCQALLATMIRLDPPIPTRPWWRSPAFGWLAPLTVAGAAVAIWVVTVDQTSKTPNVASVVAPAPPATAPLPEAQVGDQAVKKERDSLEARREKSTANRQATASVPPPVVAEPLGDAAGTPADQTAMQRTAAPLAPPSPPPNPAGARLTAAIPVAPPPAAASPAPERPSEAAAMSERARAGSVTADAAGRLATGLVQRDVPIRSADGKAWWRITPLGKVERSADGGVTWAEQDTGHIGILTAGAAVSDTVCWLVGRAGVVLLSTDGRSWRRVSFPEAVDLVSVVAADGKTATVFAAGGRSFTTTDGGATWR